MRISSSILRLILVLATLSFVYGVATSQSLRYRVVALSNPFGLQGQATCINSSKRVCGWLADTNNNPQGFYWNGSLSRIPFLGEPHYALALSLNDFDTVTGYSQVGPYSKAFTYKNGFVTNLTPEQGIDSEGYSINNNGTVLGAFGIFYARLFTSEGIVDPAEGTGFRQVLGTHLSNEGVVSGFNDLGGCTWRHGIFEQFGSGSRVVCTNDVGDYLVLGPNHQLVLESATGQINMNLMGGFPNSSNVLNNSRTAIGPDLSGFARPAVSFQGKILLLQNLIDNQLWSISTVTAINSEGSICGSARFFGATNSIPIILVPYRISKIRFGP